MHRVRLFLLCVLVLILTSCASWRKERVVFVPPPIDCEAFTPPQVPEPQAPRTDERQLAIWQLYAWNWQAYAEHVLTQRVETAACLHRLKQQGVIR